MPFGTVIANYRKIQVVNFIINYCILVFYELRIFLSQQERVRIH